MSLAEHSASTSPDWESRQLMGCENPSRVICDTNYYVNEFQTMAKAKRLIEALRVDQDEYRPHLSLGNLTSNKLIYKRQKKAQCVQCRVVSKLCIGHSKQKTLFYPCLIDR